MSERGLALRVGTNADGLPIHARMRGSCRGPYQGLRGVGVIAGMDASGVPVIAWSRQWCKAGTNRFQVGERYLGLVTGVTESGVPIITSWCETCNSTSNSSSSRQPNPAFPVTCCDNKPLKSVLKANVFGTNAHDTGVLLKRWNGGYNHPVPWLPLFLGQTAPGYTAPGWTSEVIEDFSQSYDFTVVSTPTPYTITEHYQFTDSYFFVVGFDYGIQSCGLWLHQWRERVGTKTVTRDDGGPSPVVYDLGTPTDGTDRSDMRRAWLVPNRAGACDTLTCDPFYRRQTVGSDSSSVFGFDTVNPYCAAPTIAAGSGSPGLIGVGETSTCDEPDATCTGSPLAPGGPQIEVFEPADNDPDIPFWNPEPAKGPEGFQSTNYGDGGFQTDAFQME